MQSIPTADGTVTFLNKKYNDVYHSRSGALEEAFEKYAKPTNITKFAKAGKVCILDICFGMGYNSSAAIDLAMQVNPEAKIQILGLENDLEVIHMIPSIDLPCDSYKYITELSQNEHQLYSNKNLQIKIIMGDARKTIRTVQGTFDAVFLDPFSPDKQPDLWHTSFFTDIKKIMTRDAILATYSCARMVRDNLKKAGFNVFDGPRIGRKSPSTLASVRLHHL